MQPGDQPTSQTPQPTQPAPPSANNPLASIPGMTFVAPLPAQRKSSPLPLIIGLVVLLVLGGLGVAAYLSLQTASVPSGTATTTSDVFRQAVSNGLSTGTVQRQVGGSGLDFTLLQDASTVNAPRMSVTATEKTDAGSAAFETYATLNDTYIKYISGAPVFVPSSVLNQWLWVRKAGAMPSQVDRVVGQMTELAYSTMGAYIFGNFSEAQRTELLDFLADNSVYKYDSTTVKQSTLNGKNVYIFDISFNTDNLATYNKKIGAYYGMSEASLAPLLATLKFYGPNTVYVDAEQKQIVQAEFMIGTRKITLKFDKFNATTLPAEPAATRLYSQVTPIPSL